MNSSISAVGLIGTRLASKAPASIRERSSIWSIIDVKREPARLIPPERPAILHPQRIELFLQNHSPGKYDLNWAAQLVVCFGHHSQRRAHYFQSRRVEPRFRGARFG